MAPRRQPQVPSVMFAQAMSKLSHSDLIEVVWDLVIQSPWFDETSALENQNAVIDRINEIVVSYKEFRQGKRT